MPGLLDKRLVFVTGKGGVGKSTVAGALGVMTVRRGMRTMVAELAAQHRVQQAFGVVGERFEEVELEPNLFAISIQPEHAMEEYLHLKVGALGHLLSSSRLFHIFAMATPGMRELLSIGKVWELTQHQRRTEGADVYDIVFVDAPATGHGVGFLRTPRTFSDIARVGPIARQGRAIAETIADRAFTGVLAVSTPEEMAVNETLALQDALAEEGLALDAVILNAVYPARFAEPEVDRLVDALAASESPLARSALRAAISEHARAESQREQHDRLLDGLDCPVVELPYVFCERVGPDQLQELAAILDDGLAAPRARPRAARG